MDLGTEGRKRGVMAGSQKARWMLRVTEQRVGKERLEGILDGERGQ